VQRVWGVGCGVWGVLGMGSVGYGECWAWGVRPSRFPAAESEEAINIKQGVRV
jgi:hypothetical protein